VLPFIYQDKDPKAILADIQGAPIPDAHKLMFSWIESFTRDSSSLTQDDIGKLLRGGISQQEIVEWANVAATQTWFVMSADGGGIPMEGDTAAGSVIGLERENYHQGEVLTVPTVDVDVQLSDISWTERDELKIESGLKDWALQRYGFVPNFFKANTLAAAYFRRHILAFELLDKPQSKLLSVENHALVRRWVNRLNKGRYLDQTTAEFLQRQNPEAGQLLDQGDFSRFSERERLVLDFAGKLVKNAYKVTQADVEGFIDVGLDEAAYIDVLNTTSIQTSMDRIANALGIKPDVKSVIAGA
jgi:alkylhydroperoxidase family enzyme